MGLGHLLALITPETCFHKIISSSNFHMLQTSKKPDNEATALCGASSGPETQRFGNLPGSEQDRMPQVQHIPGLERKPVNQIQEGADPELGGSS